MPKSKQKIREQVQEAVAELVEQAVEEEVTERIPGKVVHGTKTPWTHSDVAKVFPTVTFVPMHTMPVTYNGVRYQLIADIENHMPSIVKTIYDDFVMRTRRAGRKLPNLGFTTEIGAGAGGLPPE